MGVADNRLPERSAVMSLIKRLVQIAPVVAIALFILSDARPALAGCFANLKICYQGAANQMDWYNLWLAGMECELDWADCIRSEIVGR
jgi:hypothetical protein